MKYYFSKQYKRYNNGGGMQQDDPRKSNWATGINIASEVAGIASGMMRPDDMGRKPMAADALGNAAKFAQIGMAAGPLGAGIGAVVGAGVGILTNAAEKRRNDNLKVQQRLAADAAERDRSAAALANDPSLVYGTQSTGYYANGGALTKRYYKSMAVGGELEQLSSESVEVDGRTHAQGGVKLPAAGAEVEDGETIHNDFVFSEALGFAKEHRTIAKAIGKIENKPSSPERVNALNRLEERQEELKLSQEYFKQQMGLL
jgi:hypothetical protein